MNYIDPFQIPPELLYHQQTDEDINIILGENGSGKSSLLCEVAKEYLFRHDTNVIAIANTIYDKFDIRNPRLKTLKASSGKNLVKHTLKKVLLEMRRNENSSFHELGRTLEYLRFDPVIGLRLTGVNPDFEKQSFQNELPRDERNLIFHILDRFRQVGNSFPQENDSIVFFELYRSTFRDLKNSEFLEILDYEARLKRAKVIKDIEVYLYRSGRPLPVNLGSSGELTQIASMAFLTMTIREHSLVLIDEPENSLHPRWQTEYVSRLFDILYRHQPKIIIATHSPLIINSTEILSRRVNIYKGIDGHFTKVDHQIFNVEEVYQDFFDVTTPENRFMSQFLVKKLDQLTTGEISFASFEQLINEFRENSYEDKQKAALDGILVLARRINVNR